jgi:hypothetical protein
MGVLNNKDVQGQICPGLDYSSKGVGSKKSVQQGRSRFYARSVCLVREHGKMARTPLAAFFNRPSMGNLMDSAVSCPHMSHYSDGRAEQTSKAMTGLEATR